MNQLAAQLGFYYGFVNQRQREHINVDWEFNYIGSNVYGIGMSGEIEYMYTKLVSSGANR